MSHRTARGAGGGGRKSIVERRRPSRRRAVAGAMAGEGRAGQRQARRPNTPTTRLQMSSSPWLWTCTGL
eukprot:SM002556S08664  [mRNA]  locus=s2556:67:661:+ [translate_table: standard]